MRMFSLRALLFIGWLGIISVGGGRLQAQNVVYDQYFYFKEFRTEADMQGWEKTNILSKIVTVSPVFDLSSLKNPVASIHAMLHHTSNGLLEEPTIYISEDGKTFIKTNIQKGIEVGDRIFQYSITLTNRTKRIKIEYVDIKQFCIYNSAMLPISEKIIFCDFDRESDLEGWKYTGRRIEKSNKPGDYYLSNCSELISPELNLSDMRDPMISSLFDSYDSLRLLISVDGVNYNTLVEKCELGHRYSTQYRLPRNTKRVKFENIGKSGYNSAECYTICIKEAHLIPYIERQQSVSLSWIIAEGNGDLKWEKSDGICSLRGTAPAGTFTRLIMPGNSLKYAFRLNNPNPQKVKVEFNGTDISTLTSDVILSANGWDASSYQEDGYSYLKVTSIDGSPVDISLSDIRLLGQNKYKAYNCQKEYWYDDIHGGIMEFSNFGDNNNQYLYQILDEIPYSYKETENFQSFQNLNNDSIVDFITGGYYVSSSIIVRRRDGTAYEKKYLGADALVVDLNSDGRPDIVVNDKYGRAFIQLPDGTFEPHLMNIQSYEAYKNGGKNNQWSGNTGGFIVSDGIPGIREDMIVGAGGGGDATFGKLGNMLTDIDFNHDGRVDLLNENTGQLLINLGEDHYVSMQLNGKIYFRDLNGDGKLDYILYNEKTKEVKAVVDENGMVKEQTLMSNLSMDSKIWCYDFDKDGDIDILLPFSYQENNGASFLVIKINDGKGYFAEQEMAFDEQFVFIECADVDHDGYMDVVARLGESIYTSSQAILLKGGIELMFTRQSIPLATFDEEKDIMVADINQDGVYEIVEGKGNSKPGKINYLSGVSANTPPTKPIKPNFVYEPATGYLKVSWGMGEDVESSSLDLTYALRIGTEPGKGDMFYAHAYADGKRRNLQGGNMGYNLNKILDVSSWAEGKYYISIQTVDPVQNGSKWSEEAVFEKTDLSAKFMISTPKSTVDTVVVAYGGVMNKDYLYDWNFDGAEVCRVNADSSVYTLRWAIPGEKIISLQVSDGRGNSSPVKQQSFDIFANQFVNDGITVDPTSSDFRALIDLDGDGVLDALTDKGVYENDGNAHFTKVKKIYNTNLQFYSTSRLLDITGDGMAEIIDNGGRSGGEDHAMDVYKNTGNMILTKLPEKLEMNVFDGLFIDIDNDGKEDLYGYNNSVYRNSGDYKNWNSVLKYVIGYGQYGPHVADFNQDGLPDFMTSCTKDSWLALPVLYANQGNGKFKQIVFENPFGYNKSFSTLAIADINSDGYPDLITVKNVSTIVICLNNRNKDFNRTIEINLPIEGVTELTVGVVKDYDNNGYPDLMIQTRVRQNMSNHYDHGMVYFYPDGQWKYWHYGLSSSGFIANYYFDAGEHFVVDINGDGTLDGGWTNGFLNQTQVKNTPPEAPANVRAQQMDTTVLLEWDVARDAESLPAQMRYNVSVKKKGATGDGAFVISPLNGLNDKTAIIPSHYYRTATRIEIPLSAMPIGDYEIQIQSLDGWNAHSAFSPVYDFSVQKAVSVKMPAITCLNTGVAVCYTGTEDLSTLQWDWDGGRLVSQEGSDYVVAWNTEGIKRVTLQSGEITSSTSILVKSASDMSFAINSDALENSQTPLTLPELALDPSYSLTWLVAKDGSEFTTPLAWKDTLTISRRGTTRDVQVRFMKHGTYTLRLQTTTESCGILNAEKTIRVERSLPMPRIGLVTVDTETAKNRLRWGVPLDLPKYAKSINIYKEGSKYNDFHLLANVPLTQTEFVDPTSAPEVTSSRYRMTLLTDWGAESEPGAVHRSVHVMINKGMGNSWNLIWTPYEGAIVESYRVLRGLSPDNLQVIGEVAGSAMSWSDLTAPEGTLYYALEFDSEYENSWSPMLRKRRSAIRTQVRSNIVGVVDAADVVLAGGLKIRCIEKDVSLCPAQKQSLHLYADIFPLASTYRRVSWQVITGQELATIDLQGTLTAKRNIDGTVKVRAVTLDGSEVADTLIVPIIGIPIKMDSVVVKDVTVRDSTDGVIIVGASGGIPPLVYSIDNGGSFKNEGLFTGLRAGQYQMVVKDAEGALFAYDANPVVVAQPAPPTDALVIDTVYVRHESIYGMDGGISIVAKGGVPPFGYSIDNGNTFRSDSAYWYLPPGEYRVAVGDARGNIAYYQFNPVVIEPFTQVEDSLKVDTVLIHHVDVYGGSNGELAVVISGGVSPIEYSINDGTTWQLDSVFTNLSAETYQVAVKNGDGNVVYYAFNPVVVTQPAPPVDSLKIDTVAVRHVSVYGGSDGEITVLIKDGVAPFKYSIDNGMTYRVDSVFTNLLAGEYMIAFKDSTGKVAYYAHNPVTLVEPDRPAYVMEIEDFSLQGGVAVTKSRSVTLHQHVVGGVPAYYQVCEDTLQANEDWLPYRVIPVYELSEGEGEKMVYMRVGNAKGVSPWVEAGIRYEAAQSLTMIYLAINDGAELVTEQTVRLKVIVAGGIPSEMMVTFNGNNGNWQSWQSESEMKISGDEGEYVCQVKVRDAFGVSVAGEVSFYYKRAPQKLSVEDFALNKGANYTRGRMVELDYWISGARPDVYAVSEQADLKTAHWVGYESNPSYVLSEGAGMKTVYFAVANGQDTSDIVSARILADDVVGDEGLNLRLWPNPVKDILRVMLTEDNVVDETEVRVYTAMGQLVERRIYTGRELSLDASRWPFGILFVEFINDGRRMTKQIVKK